MTFTPLASSSAGNAYILDDGKTRLLIECGVPYRRLQKLTGFGIAGISGCLLSHEHKDHAKCYKELIKDGIPVYASAGTAEALDCDLMTTVAPLQEFTVGSFDVKSFPVFHDALEPFGFLVRSREDGEQLLFAADTVNIAYRIRGLHIVALECNYDEAILARATKMPEKVRARIRNSHMEIKRACAYLASLDLSNCKAVYLMHLSDACSNEGAFLAAAKRACGGVPVVVCPKQVK